MTQRLNKLDGPNEPGHPASWEAQRGVWYENSHQFLVGPTRRDAQFRLDKPSVGNSSRIVISPTRNKRYEKFKNRSYENVRYSTRQAFGPTSFDAFRRVSMYRVIEFFLLEGFFIEKWREKGEWINRFLSSCPSSIFFPRGFFNEKREREETSEHHFFPWRGFFTKNAGRMEHPFQAAAQRTTKYKKSFVLEYK